MTVTLDLMPEIEQELLTLSREQGIPLDEYARDIIIRQILILKAARPVSGKVPEMPIRHLGGIGSLHLRGKFGYSSGGNS